MREFLSPCEAHFFFTWELQGSVIHENFSKPDLSSGAHMGNQILPSIPAASSLCLKNVCRSLSTVWNHSPGWAEKRQSAKECHLDSSQCPLICQDFTAKAQAHLKEMSSFIWVVGFKPLILFLVALRNNLVAFWDVLSRVPANAFCYTNNLAVSALVATFRILLQCVNSFCSIPY